VATLAVSRKWEAYRRKAKKTVRKIVVDAVTVEGGTGERRRYPFFMYSSCSCSAKSLGRIRDCRGHSAFEVGEDRWVAIGILVRRDLVPNDEARRVTWTTVTARVARNTYREQ
jgi:hypothetical protein